MRAFRASIAAGLAIVVALSSGGQAQPALLGFERVGVSDSATLIYYQAQNPPLHCQASLRLLFYDEFTKIDVVAWSEDADGPRCSQLGAAASGVIWGKDIEDGGNPHFNGCPVSYSSSHISTYGDPFSLDIHCADHSWEFEGRMSFVYMCGLPLPVPQCP